MGVLCSGALQDVGFDISLYGVNIEGYDASAHFKFVSRLGKL
jgi:hypothetical protein